MRSQGAARSSASHSRPSHRTDPKAMREDPTAMRAGPMRAGPMRAGPMRAGSRLALGSRAAGLYLRGTGLYLKWARVGYHDPH